MGADEAAVAHVDQAALDGGQAAAPCHRELALERRAVTAVEHGLCFIQGHEQQLVLVRHGDVVVQKVTQLARLMGAGADLGHGGGREALGQKRQQVFAGGQRRVFGRAPGNVGQAAATGHQAHTHFDQTDVAFHRHHTFGRVGGQFTAAAQRQAAHRRHHRHVGVAQCQHGLLHLQFGLRDGLDTAHHEGRQHGLQVGAGREHLVVGPDHQAFVLVFGQRHRLQQAGDHVGSDRVHLGLDAGNDDLVIQRPQADGIVFKQGGAGRGGRRCLGSQHALGEMLTRIHRQASHRHKLPGRRVP